MTERPNADALLSNRGPEFPAHYAGQLDAAGRVRARALEEARPHLERAEHALELGVELIANARRAGTEINLTAAARALGVSRQTLHTRLRINGH